MDSLKRNGEGYSDPTAYKAIKNILKGMKNSMEILKGDIYFVSGKTLNDFNKGRPCVVVSNNTGNHFSDNVEVVWLTTADKKSLPTHVDVICREKAIALCECITTIKKDRLDNFVRTCTEAEIQAIDKGLCVSLGINTNDSEKFITCENITEIDTLKKQLREAQGKLQLVQAAKPALDEVAAELKQDVLKAQIERDTYKSLYESMLQKMIG
jgi:mRNA interferase MazF